MGRLSVRFFTNRAPTASTLAVLLILTKLPLAVAGLSREHQVATLARQSFPRRTRDQLFEDEVDGLEVEYSYLGKFSRTARDFANYIAANAASLISYGERFRAGERISSCLAESTVNAVIGKRFAKRQQMQWTKRGTHLLLQTRTRVLDRTLRSEFERWYPSLANDNTGAIQATTA